MTEEERRAARRSIYHPDHLGRWRQGQITGEHGETEAPERWGKKTIEEVVNVMNKELGPIVDNDYRIEE